MAASINIHLKPMEVVAVREVLFQHVLWRANEDAGRAIDNGNAQEAREAIERTEHAALMLDHVGWDETDISADPVTLTAQPTELANALDEQASRIAERMGENAIDTREGHAQMALLYGLIERIEAAAGVTA